MFELDKNLKSIILEHLSEDGMSISALSRLLKEKGIKMHRLELSGYLKALSDLNVLRERDIKPSKVFSPCQSKKKTIYQQLGEIVSQEESEDDRRANLALFVLCKLLRRAVFDKELRMCGLSGSPNSRRANDKERAEAASILVKAGMKITTNDVALVSAANLSQAYSKVVGNLLIEMVGLRQLIAETTQKTLLEE